VKYYKIYNIYHINRKISLRYLRINVKYILQAFVSTDVDCDKSEYRRYILTSNATYYGATALYEWQFWDKWIC